MANERYIGIVKAEFKEEMNNYFSQLVEGGEGTVSVPLVPIGANEESKVTHYIFSWNMDILTNIETRFFISPEIETESYVLNDFVNLYKAEHWSVEDVLNFEQLEKLQHGDI